MKTKKTIIVFAVLLVAFLAYRHFTQLSVRASTAHAAFVQNSLKSVSYQASVEANKPQAVGKIDVISFNDATFHNELMRLHRQYLGYLDAYQRFHPDEAATLSHLTAKQRYNIARAMAVARLSQTLYEAEIANVDDSDPAVLKVSVPSYASEGNGIRDFLIDKITKSSQDPALAKAMTDRLAGNFSRYGEFSQNVEMTQKVIAGDNGQPLTHVTLVDKSAVRITSGMVVPMTVVSSFLKDQMYEYTPFAAFLK